MPNARYSLRSAPRAGARHRDELLLAVGRSTGTVLNLLAKGLKARSILELGTSYGYSSVWLAEAAHETGGKVITTDLVAEKSAYATEQARERRTRRIRGVSGR